MSQTATRDTSLCILAGDGVPNSSPGPRRWQTSKISLSQLGHLVAPWFELVIYFPIFGITLVGLPLASASLEAEAAAAAAAAGAEPGLGSPNVLADPFFAASFCWITLVWPCFASLFGSVMFDEPWVAQFPLAVADGYKPKGLARWIAHSACKLVAFMPCQALFFGPSLFSYYDMFFLKEAVYVVADKSA